MYYFTLDLCGEHLNGLTAWRESYKSEETCGCHWSHLCLEARVTRDKLFEEKASRLFSLFYFLEINTFAPNSVRPVIDPLPPPPLVLLSCSCKEPKKKHTVPLFSRTFPSFLRCAAWKSHLRYKDIIANSPKALHPYDMYMQFSPVRVICVTAVQQGIDIIRSEWLTESAGRRLRVVS